jgi:hypothetical protein
MTESRWSSSKTTKVEDGAPRLLSLVGRSGPPHRPVDGLLRTWHGSSGTSLGLDEWADPATCRLADVFERNGALDDVESAVVAFAQARAGADHTVDAVAADLVALVQLAWPTGRGTWGETVEPIGLLARALGAWADERSAAAASGEWYDGVTGLVTVNYLRERLRELHDQCRALGISPAIAFGAVLVHLDVARTVAGPERMGIRITAGRHLARRFRAGETVAALGEGRLAVVMPAYGIDRAVSDVTSDLAELAALDGVAVRVTRTAFAAHPAATLRSLAGTTADT